MIKTIIFDIGGVVAQTAFDVLYKSFGERIGLPPEFVANYHKEKIDDLVLGKITLERFWQDLRGTGADPKLDLQTIWIEEGLRNRELNTGLLAIIEKLRKNYTIGVLTNLTFTRLLLDEKMNIYSHFDYVILSCREGLKKPDPAFYGLALKAASSKPEEAVFVDNKEDFIAAARAVGIKGILYTYPDNIKFSEDLGGLGVRFE